MEKLLTYLALGDSYTIGETVPLHESFPYQLVAALRRKERKIAAPEIVAKTGWTTDELELAIRNHVLLEKYDMVSLLVGVNNQYRSRPIIEFKQQVEDLIRKAILFAGDKKDNVIVLSIPDYSLTPFATEMDREKIAHEIDLFNNVIKALTIQYKTRYVDITEGMRMAEERTGLIGTDGLHPSPSEYANWVNQILPEAESLLK
jgi:lysophospholipase L1-like esterase